MRLLLAAVYGTALLLGVSGCGGGGGDADGPNPPIATPTQRDLGPTAYTELARGVYADNDLGVKGTEPLLSQQESECIARGLIKRFEIEGLREIGVLDEGAQYLGRPSGITREQAETWVDAFGACTDLFDLAFDTVRIGALSIDPKGAAAPDATWEKARACVHEKVPARYVRGVLVSSLTSAQAGGAANDRFSTCVAIAYPPAAQAGGMGRGAGPGPTNKAG